jgi:hypothetical protein
VVIHIQEHHKEEVRHMEVVTGLEPYIQEVIRVQILLEPSLEVESTEEDRALAYFQLQ